MHAGEGINGRVLALPCGGQAVGLRRGAIVFGFRTLAGRRAAIGSCGVSIVFGLGAFGRSRVPLLRGLAALGSSSGLPSRTILDRLSVVGGLAAQVGGFAAQVRGVVAPVGGLVSLVCGVVSLVAGTVSSSAGLVTQIGVAVSLLRGLVPLCSRPNLARPSFGTVRAILADQCALPAPWGGDIWPSGPRVRRHAVVDAAEATDQA